jgi:hypothetical protein
MQMIFNNLNPKLILKIDLINIFYNFLLLINIDFYFKCLVY